MSLSGAFPAGNTGFMATQSRMPILLTRPQAQSERFAADLERARPGAAEIVISPLMAPDLVLRDVPAGPFSGVVFSSETGVEAARPLRASLPDLAYCVGDRTAAAAAAAGFRPIPAEGDAESMIRLIRREAPAGRLIHPHGEETRGDVARRLTSAGIETVSVIAYRQVPQAMSAAAEALLKGQAAVIVPLFSPRTASLFCAAYRAIGGKAPLGVAAMSKAVDANVDLPSVRMRKVALHPDAASMRRAVVALIDAGPPG